MAAHGRPSDEELAALCRGQAERIEQFEAEVADLTRQSGQDSRNSSRPPSARRAVRVLLRTVNSDHLR